MDLEQWSFEQPHVMSSSDMSVVDHLNCFTMSILLHAVCVSHHFTLSFRSFCLLKVAHLFKIASLCAHLGSLCHFGSALLGASLSFLYFVAFLPLSQLGHIVQLALRDLSLSPCRSSPLLTHSHCSFISLLLSCSPISLPLSLPHLL